jgi:ATP phosphoribosyltransferase regulatory subunit
MDPISHRMVAVRADMTPQIARIAATRLPHRPRPLRLSYAGQVLRVRATQMRPERPFGPVGAELIGAAGPAADVEAIAVAGEALTAVGVPHLSVDVTLPTLVPAIAEAYDIAGERAAALRAALDRKDVAAVAHLAGEAGEVLASLVAAAGLAGPARAAFDRLDLPERARIERDRLGAVLDGLDATLPGVKVTVDPVENRGFEYHTGISFTFFARVDPALGPLGELGRGGRYQAGDPSAPEPATGFTLYTDTILRTLPGPAPRRRLFVPFEADRVRAGVLRTEGWITVAALQPAADWHEEAHRLGCDHVLDGSEVRLVAGAGV